MAQTKQKESLLVTNNAIRCKANMNHNQHRITPKDLHVLACFVAPLLHIMHVCLLARDFSFVVRFVVATYNYCAGETGGELHVTASHTGRLRRRLIHLTLAESYENQSNSDFSCHYAMLRSRISDFASANAPERDHGVEWIRPCVVVIVSGKPYK